MRPNNEALNIPSLNFPCITRIHHISVSKTFKEEDGKVMRVTQAR